MVIAACGGALGDASWVPFVPICACGAVLGAVEVGRALAAGGSCPGVLAKASAAGEGIPAGT